jgi:hypothetical protein
MKQVFWGLAFTSIIALSVLAAPVSRAAEPDAQPHAVNLQAQITQLNGKPLLDEKTGKDFPLSLGDVVKSALLTTDTQTPPAEKDKRFWLAVKVNGAKEMTFTPEELVTIKELIYKYQSILVAGQAVRLLDPTSIPKK